MKLLLCSAERIFYSEIVILTGKDVSGWFYLAIAIILEVAGTFYLKLSDGFTDLTYGITSLVLYCLCFLFFAPALKKLPMGVMYAIWSGAGIVGIAVLGYFYFEQALSFIQMGFLGLILIGAIGLNMTTQET